mmetsp:Transcript_8607/g.21188  ORF Transcript_8607/g.21188 Transcript_8607/m.21188 type:complete len:237 (+) Transcript_8607:642-1352(+)
MYVILFIVMQGGGDGVPMLRWATARLATAPLDICQSQADHHGDTRTPRFLARDRDRGRGYPHPPASLRSHRQHSSQLAVCRCCLPPRSRPTRGCTAADRPAGAARQRRSKWPVRDGGGGGGPGGTGEGCACGAVYAPAARAESLLASWRRSHHPWRRHARSAVPLGPPPSLRALAADRAADSTTCRETGATHPTTSRTMTSSGTAGGRGAGWPALMAASQHQPAVGPVAAALRWRA